MRKRGRHQARMILNIHDGSMRVEESREDVRRRGTKHGDLTGGIVDGTLNGTKCVSRRRNNSMRVTKLSSETLEYVYSTKVDLKYASLGMSNGFSVSGSVHDAITMSWYEVGVKAVVDAAPDTQISRKADDSTYGWEHHST